MQEKYFKQFTDDVTFSKLVHIRTTYELYGASSNLKKRLGLQMMRRK